MTRVVVYHSYYGCDTQCCGHVVEVDGDKSVYRFDFGHPRLDTDESKREFAEMLIRRELGEEHVADLDWENSWIVYD